MLVRQKRVSTGFIKACKRISLTAVLVVGIDTAEIVSGNALLILIIIWGKSCD